VVVWYFFPVLVCCSKKNLATPYLSNSQPFPSSKNKLFRYENRPERFIKNFQSLLPFAPETSLEIQLLVISSFHLTHFAPTGQKYWIGSAGDFFIRTKRKTFFLGTNVTVEWKQY
jgi:hypothetical protein